jgi:hypothetical protein
MFSDRGLICEICVISVQSSGLGLWVVFAENSLFSSDRAVPQQLEKDFVRIIAPATYFQRRVDKVSVVENLFFSHL